TGIKSANSTLLGNITGLFHELIKKIFLTMQGTDDKYYLYHFSSCLMWDLNARNHELINEMSFFRYIFSFMRTSLKEQCLKANDSGVCRVIKYDEGTLANKMFNL